MTDGKYIHPEFSPGSYVTCTNTRRTAGTIEGDVGRALLGTNNGNAVAFFLAQHRAEIGKKLTISQVRFWGNPGNDWVRFFLFYVKEASEYPDAIKETDEEGVEYGRAI